MVISGTVRGGVQRGVLVLDDAAGRSWQLLGRPIRALRPGTQVSLSGRPDDARMAGTAQQGRRFIVETIMG